MIPQFRFTVNREARAGSCRGPPAHDHAREGLCHARQAWIVAPCAWIPVRYPRTECWSRIGSPGGCNHARTTARYPLAAGCVLPSMLPMAIWPEHQAAHWSRWLAEPSPHSPTISWEGRSEQLRVVRHSAPICTTFRHDNEAADRRCIPTKWSGDRGSQSNLAVDSGHQYLEVDQGGLQLYQQQRSCFRMPREQVDDPSLAVLCEGDLRPDCPPATRQPANNCLTESGMRPIQQPIQLAAAPAHSQLETEVQGRHDSPDGTRWQLVQVAALHA
jgi:hypothetical protein